MMGVDYSTPQSYREAKMLYIKAKINGRDVAMLIDTGAERSIISSSAMRSLGLSRRLNTSTQGTARGVGEAAILGTTENVEIIIKGLDVLMDFYVLDANQMMIIFGLDMLKRLGCIIDLPQNRMLVGGPDGIPAKFLSETEIPPEFSMI